MAGCGGEDEEVEPFDCALAEAELDLLYDKYFDTQESLNDLNEAIAALNAAKEAVGDTSELEPPVSDNSLRSIRVDIDWMMADLRANGCR